MDFAFTSRGEIAFKYKRGFLFTFKMQLHEQMWDGVGTDLEKKKTTATTTLPAVAIYCLYFSIQALFAYTASAEVRFCIQL